MKKKIFNFPSYQNRQGYQGFPMDNLANFTSVCGYLYPVYWDILEPGDKVDLQTLLRTRTQPFAKPAMATIHERIEWFAVPIDQIFRPFKTKFYGINDVETDLLPTTGYNSTLPFIKLDTIGKFLNMCPTTLELQATIAGVSGQTVPTFGEAKRLCDCFGLPMTLGETMQDGKTFGGSVSALPFAAYQKIYYDHYRITDRELNDVQAYNLDSFAGTSSLSSEIPSPSSLAGARLTKLMTLRKRPYCMDYFTSMKVSPLMGSADVNSAGVELGKVQQWLSGLTEVKSAIPESSSAKGSVAASTSEPTTTFLNNPALNTSGYIQAALSTVNPANIRSMFAVEKLLEVTRRAKKHYDMQTLAHFGVSVPKGLSGECFKLGTSSQYIKIGDVVSTAATENEDFDTGAALGQLAGRGESGGQSQHIKFEAKAHCILMAIYSAEPVMNYRNTGCERLISRTDISEFYKPELDNLGMQPVFHKELYNFQVSASGTTHFNDVLGWQARNQEQKTKYNRSFMGCATNYFNEWALNRDVINNASLSRNFFFVWPTDLNDVLQFNFSGTENYSSVYAEDYFINQIYFNCKKSSKKSLYGVPNL